MLKYRKNIFRIEWKNLTRKAIGLLFIISIVINILFTGNVIKSNLSIFTQKKINQKPEIKQSSSITYFVNRNEIFEQLPNDSAEIIMLGNSLTQNFEWHEIFRSVNIKNRGINSDGTAGVLQRLDEVTESNPKKIFIQIGINDLRRNYSLDSTYNNFVKIIEAIKYKSPLTKIYVQSLLPSDKSLNNRTIDFNKRLKYYCDQNKITYLDLYSSFISGQGLNPMYDCGDNLHLSGKGYLEWCRLIKPYIHE